MKPVEGKDFWSDIAPPEAVAARARDGDPLERWAAIFALGDIDQPWAIDELRRLSEDSEDLVSQAAHAALKRLQEAPTEPERTRRQFSWVVRQYTRRLADRAALDHVRLVPLLEDARPDIRAAAARALGEAGDVSALQVLCRTALDDREPLVRRASALALGVLEDSRASETLQELLQDDDAGVRAAAAAALGDICDPEAGEALCVSLLDDDDAEVRASACLSLGVCGAVVADSAFSREREMVIAPRAIDAIEEAAADDLDDGVRALAAEVLLQVKDRLETFD